VPPLHLATTFLREPDNSYPEGHIYGRPHNPTYLPAEALLAGLEGGEAALLFASGMAAATSVFLALRPGDRVLAPPIMYWGLRKWLLTEARHWGLEVDLVDTTDLEQVRAALKHGRTRLVWLETPANPSWEVSDIQAIAFLAHEAGAMVAVDNTVPTPVLTRPIELGADLVMHSASKYLNGHSDVIAGALITKVRNPFWERIIALRTGNGGILGGFEAWLLLRGLRTLFIRVERACRTAEALARHFEGHERVRTVLYPGLASAPGHAIARRQMRGGFGGMLSLRVAGGEAAAIAVAAKTRLWKRATSLGGVESLIEHRASIEGAESPVPPDLLRLSAGLEASGDLIADLEEALR